MIPRTAWCQLGSAGAYQLASRNNRGNGAAIFQGLWDRQQCYDRMADLIIDTDLLDRKQFVTDIDTGIACIGRDEAVR